MFDLRTHIYKTASDGTPYLAAETTYRRVSVAGYPPIYIRNGEAYYESGEIVSPVPEVFKEIAPELFPSETGAVPTTPERYEYDVKTLRRYERMGFTVDTKPSERFLRLDAERSQCRLCGEIVPKNRSGIHILRKHKDIDRRHHAACRTSD